MYRLASRAEPAHEPISSRAEPHHRAREVTEPSLARLAIPPSLTEPSLARLGSFPALLTLASYSCAMEISSRPRRRLLCLPHPKSPSEKMAQYYQLELRKWYVLLLPINECIIKKARTALINQCVMLRQLSAGAGPFFLPSELW